MTPVHERVLRRCTDTDNPTACWEWTGACFRYGYGNVRCRRDDGTWGNRGTHVVMWEHDSGLRLPDGYVIMHLCNNAPCCNPAHLIIGTQADNVQHAASLGRMARPDGNPWVTNDPTNGRFMRHPRHPAGH
jgi:hypothetical protein